ncbi:hypothetical protein HYU14_06405 [Candidatus Woesearchaeota archaeon]|nr:hypothetical protein [Candidatus Woesearchaeota archaeon]
MAPVTLQQIHEDLAQLRLDMLEVKARLNEEFRLSPQAARELEEARLEMKTSFVSHKDIMEKFG